MFERAGYQEYADVVRKLVQPQTSHEVEDNSKPNSVAPSATKLSQEPVFPELPEFSSSSLRVATATAAAVLIKQKGVIAVIMAWHKPIHITINFILYACSMQFCLLSSVGTKISQILAVKCTMLTVDMMHDSVALALCSCVCAIQM